MKGEARLSRLRNENGSCPLGEIKSAIELAMERTKNLVMDDDEKREFARKNLEDKLRAAARRFLEGMITGEDFLQEYKDLPGDRIVKLDFLVSMIGDEFQTSTDSERLFSLLETIGNETGHGAMEEAQGLRAWFATELGTRGKEIRKRVMARLEEIGISGDAVEPNIPEWEESQDIAREIGGLMRSRLQKWKERLEAAL
jgi:hypothetical protein